MQHLFLKIISTTTLFILATSNAFAQVNVQVIPSVNGCKGVIIYNNTNHLLVITVSYLYEGRGGSYLSGDTPAIEVSPRTNVTYPWLYNGPVDCAKPYNLRITNYRFVDKTAVQEQQQAAQQRRAEAERQRRQQENTAAEARRQQELERLKRQKEAEKKRQDEEHERRVRASRKPWIQGCPKGLQC